MTKDKIMGTALALIDLEKEVVQQATKKMTYEAARNKILHSITFNLFENNECYWIQLVSIPTRQS